MSETNFKKIPRNILGRDFVVGDIHGSFNLLLEALHEAQFDVNNDRLFSLGDTIDRGPDSRWCLDFLAQPFVFAVRGNHEEMALSLYADGPPDPATLEFAMSHNGFGWWRDVPEAERQAILREFRKLPIALETDTARGTVGFVHADVPTGMDWEHFTANLLSGDKKTLDTALWGRDRIQGRDWSGVVGVGRLFVGHTPQWNGLKRFGNVYATDTGAVFGINGEHDGGRLTMADLTATTVYCDLPKRRNGVDVRLADRSASDQPLGNYAHKL